MNTQKQKTKDRQGFALIISVTLMSFIFLLMVALASLTSLETQSALHTSQNVEAQQNALVALDLALGELQKYAGPDQRVTARADLEYGATAGQPYWTAVYGSSIAADYDATPEEIATALTDSNNVNAQGSPAKLLNWLVSGNELVPFDPTTDVGDSGEILDAPSSEDIAFKPQLIVSNIGSATATSTDLTIQNASGTSQAARLLVGPASVVESSDYVAAPLVEIESSTGTGGYAWWIGDEGIKARADLPLETEDDDKLNAFVNSTRAAVEVMAKGEYGIDQSDNLTAERIDVFYDPLAPNDRVLQTSELALSSTNPDDFSEILRYRFHDITTNSQSVLSDTYAGGLKRDLTTLLDESYTPDSDDPTANDNRLWVPHSEDTTGYAIPTWGHLRSFAQTRVPTTGIDIFKVAPRLPVHDKDGVADDVGIAPVLTYFSLGFRAAPDAVPGAGVKINMNLYPLVVLWNPYNVTIKAPDAYLGGGNYEVGMYPHWDVTVALDVLDPDPAGTYLWKAKEYFNFATDVEDNGNKKSFIRFRLNCPDIPPGQSLIFSIPSSISGAHYSQTDFPVLENITPNATGHVSIPFTSFESDEEAAMMFRLADAFYETSWAPGNFGNLSDSFSSGGSGTMYVYLGEPSDTSVLMDVDDSLTYNPSSADRRWYQTHQEIGWDKNDITPSNFEAYLLKNGTIIPAGSFDDELSVQQDPDILLYESSAAVDEPAYSLITHALFSGHGSSAQLDSDQHMFPTRWIAQGNMRGLRTGRTRRDQNYNPLSIATTGVSGPTEWQKFQVSESESNRASAGQGHDEIDGVPVDATLFEFPYEDQPFFSIAQLQHANLSFIGAYPSYPIGNSLADFRLHSKTLGGSGPPVGYELARVDFQGSANRGLKGDMIGYYDVSFLLNRMLWDRYFFSTTPATGVIPETLANSRFSSYGNKDLQDPDQASAGLLLEGGFNINSTSEQAWRAILAGTNQLEYDPENPNATINSPLSATFTRFTSPTSGSDPNDAWEGYRTLSEAQIAQLARNIVIEIKNRGPFVSLSDFVNRRLVDNSNTTESFEYENFRGTIQAAIDRTKIVDSEENKFAVNNAKGTFWESDDVPEGLQGDQFNYAYSKERIYGGNTAEKPYSNLSSFAPKYITQADILSTIGSSLTARSDTFVIRTYGEVANPFSPDEIVSRAWCEAVVQRYPEYVDVDQSNDLPEKNPTEIDNINFGRQFKIVSFRWLSADEV